MKRHRSFWKRRFFIPVLNRYRDLTMQKKISLAFLLLMVPMVIFVGIWFVNVLDASENYDKAIRNTSIISEFNLDFKKNYDYKIYLITTGNKTYNEQHPEEDITYAKDIIMRVKMATENTDSLECIKRCERYFEVLENYTKKIRQNVMQVGKYDENRDLWENGVQLVTTNIQNTMLQLLYYENRQSAIAYDDMQTMTRNMSLLSLVLVAFLAAAATMMVTIIPRGITKPIRYLSTVTKEVADGNLGVRVHMEHGAEMKILADSLNVMIEKIQTLIDNVMLEQIRLREAELEILQMQINPHFLYNTLDTIVWLAEAGDKEAVVEMVQTLTEFFRSSLNSGKDIVSIESEIRHVSSYLQIQQVRYQDILDYEISLTGEIDDFQIPKITLQPLVENALYHGIKYKRGKGKILVSGRVEENRCVLSVCDDGVGMTEERLKQVRSGLTTKIGDNNDFYGLYNVNERIRLKFGEEYGLHIDSVEQRGTVVEVWLPMTDRSDCPAHQKIFGPIKNHPES